MYQALLASLARALDAAGIPYMVIGGQAVLLHGEPRLTRYIDITLGTDSGALEKLASVAERLGLTPAVPNMRDFVRTTNVLLMLVAARLRHIAGTKWGTKKYVDTGLLEIATKVAARRG